MKKSFYGPSYCFEEISIVGAFSRHAYTTPENHHDIRDFKDSEGIV